MEENDRRVFHRASRRTRHGAGEVAEEHVAASPTGRRLRDERPSTRLDFTDAFRSRARGPHDVCLLEARAGRAGRRPAVPRISRGAQELLQGRREDLLEWLNVRLLVCSSGKVDGVEHAANAPTAALRARNRGRPSLNRRRRSDRPRCRPGRPGRRRKGPSRRRSPRPRRRRHPSRVVSRIASALMKGPVGLRRARSRAARRDRPQGGSWARRPETGEIQLPSVREVQRDSLFRVAADGCDGVPFDDDPALLEGLEVFRAQLPIGEIGRGAPVREGGALMLRGRASSRAPRASPGSARSRGKGAMNIGCPSAPLTPGVAGNSSRTPSARITRGQRAPAAGLHHELAVP